MGFADLLDEVGGFGRYQWLHVTLISLPGLLMASQNLLNNFVSGIPTHHCTLLANQSLYNLSHYQMDEKQLLKAFIPPDSSGNRLDRCRRYVEPQWQLLAANSSANVSQLQTEGCMDGWTFDRSEFYATTVSEWDLVCSLRPLKQMIQTIYMGGVLTGAIIYGGLSDRFGRRSVLIWSYLQLGVLGCSSALSPSYSTYCVFRFLSGMAVSGVILNGVSLKVEWIPTKARTLVGTLTSFFFTFGQMILAGLAYWLRDWRKLQVITSAPHLLFFAYSWWYSESARWLVLKQRSEEALKTLHRVARINGKPEIIDKLTLEVLHSHMNKEIESSRSSFTMYDLLRTRGMRRISICLIAVWFSTSFAYYGLAMDLQKFGLLIFLPNFWLWACSVTWGGEFLRRCASSCRPSSSLPTSSSLQTCRHSGQRWRVLVKVSPQRPSPPFTFTPESSIPPSSGRQEWALCPPWLELAAWRPPLSSFWMRYSLLCPVWCMGGRQCLLEALPASCLRR
ncbi:hypothetical protein PAMA_005601 [Pampus argenteus]